MIPQVKATKLEGIPVPKIRNPKDVGVLESLGKTIHELEIKDYRSRLISEKAMIRRQIDALWLDLEQIVRRLYDLTDDEWSVVEDLTKQSNKDEINAA